MAAVEKRSVLVALSPDQREARATDLAHLERPGVEFVFEESPEVALDLVKKTRPSIVLVGMTLGDVEGLEFLAMLFKNVPDFAGKVIVVPDKGDPFPPMLQGRDPVTRKSTTTAIDFDKIAALVDGIAPPPAPVAPPASPAPPPPVAAPAPTPTRAEASAPTPAAFVEPAPPVPAYAPEPLPASAPAETLPRRQGKGMLVLGAAVVLVGLVGAAIWAFTRTSPSPDTPARAPVSSTQVGTTSPPPSAPATTVDRPHADDTATPSNAPYAQLTTLPLSFAKNSAEFEITDAAQLDSIIDGIKRSLGTSTLEIGGHTSTEGSERVNEELSLRRAASVKRYLVGRGIAEDRIVVKDYKTSAAAPSAAQEVNRRVTVRILR